MFQEDLHIFVNDFGSELIFTLSDGSILQYYDEDKPIKGIFDDSYADKQLGNMIIQMDSPILTCVGDDIKTVKKNDTVLLSGVSYNISKITPVGDGMTILELEKL